MFYAESPTHDTMPRPRLVTKGCGARYWDWTDPRDYSRPSTIFLFRGRPCTPVSTTTLHMWNVDWRIASADILRTVVEVALMLGTEVLGYHFDRYDGFANMTGSELRDYRENLRMQRSRRYDKQEVLEPTGHVYIAIKPGHSERLIAFVELLDQCCYPVSVNRSQTVTLSNPVCCQLSRRELVVFDPSHRLYFNRRLVDGPKYHSELTSPHLWSDLDVLSWHAGETNQRFWTDLKSAHLSEEIYDIWQSKHDMLREYNVLKNFKSQFSKVPDVFLFCDNDKILGTPFYLMERVEGYIIRPNLQQQDSPNSEVIQSVSKSLVNTLVELHLSLIHI